MQMLAPVPVGHNAPRFDKWQFAGRRQKATSAKSKLSFSDYERMHVRRTEQGTHRYRDTSWANNNQRLREVLAVILSERLLMKVEPTPSSIRLADRLFTRQSNEFLDSMRQRLVSRGAIRPTPYDIQKMTSITLVKMAGDSLSAWYLAIIYRSLRLGENSCTVAEAMHMTPTHVRQQLARLSIIATKLEGGMSVGECSRQFASCPYVAGKRSGNSRQYSGIQHRRWDNERKNLLFTLKQQGLPDKQIAERLGLKYACSAASAYRYFFGKTPVTAS